MSDKETNATDSKATNSKATDSKATDAKDGAKPRSAVLDDPPLPVGDEEQVLAVQRARALFHIGDYAGVRDTIAPLLASNNPAMVDAATELQKRITVDPIQIAFLMACFATIVTISLYYLGH